MLKAGLSKRQLRSYYPWLKALVRHHFVTLILSTVRGEAELTYGWL
jgi:hypothetical protein